MDTAGLAELIAAMRRIGGEPTDIEVKKGEGGYPKSVADSMVSFANTRGGTILIGIDEYADFAITGVDHPADYRDAAVGQATDAIEPPLDIGVDIVEIDGTVVMVVEVPESAPSAKPVYLKAKGIANGALTRTAADGDRRMTAAELGLLWASRSQPRDDRRPEPEATIADLARPRLLRTLERVRGSSPSLRDQTDEVLMRRLGIAVEVDGRLTPTLAGLLAFCDFPQEFHPQLMISFVALGDGRDGERFLDNVAIRGSIPAMVADAVSAVRRNLSTRNLISSEGREERLDYSMESVREAVANALLHRDYSEITRGTQVQIELRRDELVITSPGGLFGPVSEEALGEEGLSSSRNAVLASLLSDVYLPGSERLVVENRASGIPTMLREARRRGQLRPRFTSTVTRFSVSLSRSALLDPAVQRWIASLDVPGLTEQHELALAMMRAGSVTNEMLREWGVDGLRAATVLRDLVARGTAVKEGGRRYARYVLAPDLRPRDAPALASSPEPSGDPLLAVLSATEWMPARSIQERTGFGRSWVVERLRDLAEAGVVEVRGAPTSPQRAYRLHETK